MAHHVLHLVLLGRALPHHGELYLARGILAHGKAALGTGHKRRPAGLARGEGGREAIEAAGYQLRALFTRPELVELAKED
jgi:hypothetical protein